MTWTKLGVEFFDDLAERGLSDAGVRTHAEALGFLYRVESGDMRIRRTLIPRFAGSSNWQAAVEELLDLGLWQNQGEYVRVVHHGDVFRQSLASQQIKRENDKKAQRNKRARDTKSPDVSGGVSADVSASVSGDTDRQTDLQTAAVAKADDWSVSVVPGSRSEPACRDCGSPLTNAFQVKSGICNRCATIAKARGAA